ncbi:MAG: hypothetical protein M0P16_07250 [Syntrophales bacterium]|jgi:hypothetical protein|nr:hypothetical protein [Syntrophales bacterium]
MKMDSTWQQRVHRYVRDRRCREGGYCFYRLEEPNSSDTYWALAILYRLGLRVQDGDTACYLQSFQRVDGGFENFQIAYFALKGLQLLNSAPLNNHVPYLMDQLHVYDVQLIPAGESSIFKHMYLLVDMCVSLGVPLQPPVQKQIAAFVLNQQAPDGGFGRDYGTLIETAQALAILQWVDNFTEYKSVADFVSRCENPLFGFVNVPRTMPGYIEHVYWGLQARRFAGGKPVYPETCMEVVMMSQNLTGGFSRTTYGGIANLENTFFAVESLEFLKFW